VYLFAICRSSFGKKKIFSSSTHYLIRLFCYLVLLVSSCIVQSLSRVQLFVTPWTVAHQDSLSYTISWALLKLMSIESVMPSNHFILCHPFFLLPPIFPNIRLFPQGLCSRWPKYWSFSFSISPSKEYSGLISYRIDWFDLLAVQVTRKSLLNHHSSKASILWCSIPYTFWILLYQIYGLQISSPTL